MTASLSTIAQRFSFVRETEGPNAGAWVNLFQRFTGGVEGESWCADFMSYCLDVAYKGKSPLRKSSAANVLYQQCRNAGYLVTTPAVDDVFFYLDDADHAHHVGVVTVTAPLSGFAGNTSEDGTSTNGTGAFNHELHYPRIAFARLPQ